jgi:hypothetical protein
MTSKEYKEVYEKASGTLSDNVRKIAFIGFGVVWMFKTSKDGISQIPNGLIAPAIWLIFCLLLDLFQYFVKFLIFSLLFKKEERYEKEESEKKNQGHWKGGSRIIDFFFYGKFLCLIIAAVQIAIYLFKEWGLGLGDLFLTR